jgi:hypothetical protein
MAITVPGAEDVEDVAGVALRAVGDEDLVGLDAESRRIGSAMASRRKS